MDETVNFRTAINGFNRTDVLSYIKKLMDKNAALSTEVTSANIKIAELSAEIETYKSLLGKREVEHQNERVLGRAMYDARRFSDTIVLEAHDDAVAMLDNATESADLIMENADAVSQNALSAAESIGSSMDHIRMQLEQLCDNLSEFKKTIEERKECLPTHAAIEEDDDNAPEEDPADASDDEAGEATMPAPTQQHTRIKIRKVKH